MVIIRLFGLSLIDLQQFASHINWRSAKPLVIITPRIGTGSTHAIYAMQALMLTCAITAWPIYFSNNRSEWRHHTPVTSHKSLTLVHSVSGDTSPEKSIAIFQIE